MRSGESDRCGLAVLGLGPRTLDTSGRMTKARVEEAFRESENKSVWKCRGVPGIKYYVQVHTKNAKVWQNRSRISRDVCSCSWTLDGSGACSSTSLSTVQVCVVGDQSVLY